MLNQIQNLGTCWLINNEYDNQSFNVPYRVGTWKIRAEQKVPKFHHFNPFFDYNTSENFYFFVQITSIMDEPENSDTESDISEDEALPVSYTHLTLPTKA